MGRHLHHAGRVPAFGRLAENIAASLTTGTDVVLVGETETHTETWVDRKTEENRSKNVVIVRAVGPDLDWATVTVSRNPKPSDA